MKVELINIGDELLIGQTINTNASWLGKFFAERGIRIFKTVVITDEREDILNQMDISFKRSDVVIITGGLGPTKDDITKKTLAEYFKCGLVMNQEMLDRNTAYFASTNRPMLQINTDQALVPEKCEVLVNTNGTAPGMLFRHEGTLIFSLPGVPYEMQAFIEHQVFPILQGEFDITDIYQESVMTTGRGESYLADKIADWENKMREDGLSLAYLPSPGVVRLRVSSYAGKKDKQKVQTYVAKLIDLLGDDYYGKEGETLSCVVGKYLKHIGLTLSTVESCTSGSLASNIVKTPGSSQYYEGSLVTYSYAMKSHLAGVAPEIYEAHGAVSKECVEAMAIGGRERLKSDFCLATSGIAGPDGGTADKPVGSVWIALAHPNGVISKFFLFKGNRDRNIHMSVLAALNLLRLHLLEHYELSEL
jgi:nicotinamide-nucleotide amidase